MQSQGHGTQAKETPGHHLLITLAKESLPFRSVLLLKNSAAPSLT
jgi:hypothetical protein